MQEVAQSKDYAKGPAYGFDYSHMEGHGKAHGHQSMENHNAHDHVHYDQNEFGKYAQQNHHWFN